MRNIFTKLFAVMAMSVMTLTVFAGDFNGSNSSEKITLPSAVDLSYGTYKGFNRNEFFSNANKIEYSQANATAQFTLAAGETASYILYMQASNGNPGGTYDCNLEVKIWSTATTEPEDANVTFTVEDDDNWNNFKSYAFSTPELTADQDYYLKITWGDQANVQNIKFMSAAPSTFVTPSTTAITISTTSGMSGYYYKTADREKNQETLGFMNQGDYIEFPVNVTTAGDHMVSFQASLKEGDPAVISVSMTKFASSTIVTKDLDVAVTGNWGIFSQHRAVFTNMTSGLYLMRVSWKTGGPNFKNLYLYSPDLFPWPSSSALDLQPGTYHNATWNNDNVINYIKAAGASIDNLIMYNESDGFYNFCFNISSFKQNSIVGITIIDLATGNTEVNNQTLEVSSNGDKIIRIAPQLSAGWKKIRFDFTDNDAGNADEHLFNFQTVTFPAVSYDPLPLTGDAVLDLSQWPTSGNPRYQSGDQNLGYIYHNNTAYFYVNNTNPTAHYHLSAGIRTNVSDANLVVTVTDVATSNAEINEEAFDVAEGNSSYPIQTFALSGAIAPGLKLITFKFTKDDGAADPWLYNINNISFTMLRYTREHPHMNLNTLCFPYQVDTYTGATFYTILSTEVEDGNLTKLVLEEHVGALTAGTPYFYDPTEGADELVCYYSSAEQVTPQTAANGAFVGAYADNTAVPEGSYVTVNNQLYKCGANVTLAEYRAYVSPVVYARAAMPGRKLLTIGGNKTPTDIESVSATFGGSQKILRNGQLLIIRDGKTYNAQGQLIEK